jgi:hypothetical protein
MDDCFLTEGVLNKIVCFNLNYTENSSRKVTISLELFGMKSQKRKNPAP